MADVVILEVLGRNILARHRAVCIGGFLRRVHAHEAHRMLVVERPIVGHEVLYCPVHIFRVIE